MVGTPTDNQPVRPPEREVNLVPLQKPPLYGYISRMSENDLKELCARVSTLMEQVDELSDLPAFIETLDDIDQVLAGAAVARGYLSGAVTISSKTIPLISAAELALAEFVENLDEEGDEDADE